MMTWPPSTLPSAHAIASDPSSQIGPNTHCLPLFVIAGAWKCGTTSLWAAMSSHPSALHPKQKELRVFGTAASGKVRTRASRFCTSRDARVYSVNAMLMRSPRQQVTPKQYASMFPAITHPTHFTYESSPSAYRSPSGLGETLTKRRLPLLPFSNRGTTQSLAAYEVGDPSAKSP